MRLFVSHQEGQMGCKIQLKQYPEVFLVTLWDTG